MKARRVPGSGIESHDAHATTAGDEAKAAGTANDGADHVPDHDLDRRTDGELEGASGGGLDAESGGPEGSGEQDAGVIEGGTWYSGRGIAGCREDEDHPVREQRALDEDPRN